MSTVARIIEGFEQDEDGAWIAALDCGHRRHVRHRPPLEEQPWIEDAAAREAKIGESIECVSCAVRELPADAEPYKTTKVFDEHSLPAGLRAAHQTKRGVWGRLHVLEGSLTLVFEDPLSLSLELSTGDRAIIPPQLAHFVTPLGPVRVQLEFLAVARAVAEQV